MSLDIALASVQLKIEAPQYDDSDFDAAINYFLAQAVLNMDLEEGVWGIQYQRAAVLWALHHLAVRDEITQALTDPTAGSGGISTVGSVRRRKARELEVEYGASRFDMSVAQAGESAGDAYWMLTPYGQEYLRLRGTRATIAAPFSAGAASWGPGDAGWPYGPYWTG